MDGGSAMKILLATDGSECSDWAAKFLTRFDFSRHDEIFVLHVVSEIPYEDDYHAQIKHAIKRVAPKILNSSRNILAPLKANISVIEEEGYPDTSIIGFAVNSGVDLIVMGARGIKGAKLLFLGSTSRSVAINSPIPVLATRRPKEEPVHEKMKILFATDGSELADSTGRILTSMPFPADTEVTVMNVAWSTVSALPEKIVVEIDDRYKENVAKARTIEYAEAEKLIEHARTSLSRRFKIINGVVQFGDPSIEILDEAERLNPDIIAVGCRGRRGLTGMLGSVSRRILGNASCAVLVGKTG
jgi:nucleotide-binding universal stress UspA family protein